MREITMTSSQNKLSYRINKRLSLALLSKLNKSIFAVLLSILVFLAPNLSYAASPQNEVLKRAELSKSLLLAIYGNEYIPPATSGIIYSDVKSGDFNADWIKKLTVDEITEGCAVDRFCPEMVVTKEQLAKILLKAKFGTGYTPPLPSGTFTDVDSNDFAAGWIEGLVNQGITEGCAVDRFCPKEAVTVEGFEKMLSVVVTIEPPGTGTCVNITSPKAGDSSLIQNVAIVGENSLVTEIKTTYTAVSNTSWSYDSEGKSGLGTSLLENLLPGPPDLTFQTTETFTIANNFINITKSEVTVPALGLVTTTFSPPRSAPINEVCEGQIFTQNYTETTVNPGGTDIEQVSTKNTIEAVNVQKSTPAGTFNTYQLKSEIEGGILTFWFDTETSTLVLLETRDAATDDLLSTSTLMTLTSQ